VFEQAIVHYDVHKALLRKEGSHVLVDTLYV
jgi:hypothetical protein